MGGSLLAEFPFQFNFKEKQAEAHEVGVRAGVRGTCQLRGEGTRA